MRLQNTALYHHFFSYLWNSFRKCLLCENHFATVIEKVVLQMHFRNNANNAKIVLQLPNVKNILQMPMQTLFFKCQCETIFANAYVKTFCKCLCENYHANAHREHYFENACVKMILEMPLCKWFCKCYILCETILLSSKTDAILVDIVILDTHDPRENFRRQQKSSNGRSKVE